MTTQVMSCWYCPEPSCQYYNDPWHDACRVCGGPPRVGGAATITYVDEGGPTLVDRDAHVEIDHERELTDQTQDELHDMHREMHQSTVGWLHAHPEGEY